MLFTKRKYDFVYLTNTPSFYKINLCNEIAKRKSVLLVLYGYGTEAVNANLEYQNDYDFDFVFLFNGNTAKRNKFNVLLKLFHLMINIDCKAILYTGWYVPEYIIYSFFSPKKKNVLVCESSTESNISGIKGFVKRVIINRMYAALASGTPHSDLLLQLGFKGLVIKTGGVGIINKVKKNENDPKILGLPLKYLFIGRLTEVKNIELLISEFNESGKLLTIVKPNISFYGFIDNKNLFDVYKNHDVFVLPSKSEPWGLVIDEALYFGLPVIVSNKVGSAIDLVKIPQTGCIFQLDVKDSLKDAIIRMESSYHFFKKNVDNMNFCERDRVQINSYNQLLNA